MPRGDGKKSGQPRSNRKVVSSPQFLPKWLKRRQDAYESADLTPQDGYIKPGSQRRKR